MSPLKNLATALRDRGYRVEWIADDGDEQMVAHASWFRWRWMATRLHLIVVANHVSHATQGTMVVQRGKAMAAAQARFTGTRGLQQGYAVVPLLLAPSADHEVTKVADRTWEIEFARFVVPAVLVNTTFLHAQPPPFLGKVYHSHVNNELTAMGAALL